MKLTLTLKYKLKPATKFAPVPDPRNRLLLRPAQRVRYCEHIEKRQIKAVGEENDRIECSYECKIS